MLGHEKELSIREELNQLSLKRQQLTDRRNVLALLIEFKQNSGQNEQQYSKENDELQEIDRELKVLSDRKIQLQIEHDKLEGRYNNLIDTTVSSAVNVENPPSVPAPQVILDVEQLPPHPCQTQCPHCHEYITTEITKTTSSSSYLICCVLITFGCVAGCCFIPFCMNSCKNVIHKCPRCRSHIYKCKNL